MVGDKNKVDKFKAMLLRESKVEPLVDKDFLSTGSTLLNLACSDRLTGGFAKGKYYFIVGDSASGKTFLSLTCLAEASINRNFDNYRFIFDNAEGGALMNIGKFFGSDVASRLEAPRVMEGQPVCSKTVEEFYYNVADAFKDGRPFIYILDSMDSLSCTDEQDKFKERKTAFEKGKEAAGTYNVGKSKENSSSLRTVLTPLQQSGSILIIISQTRDNLGFGFEKKTRSGGNALRFYATIELWSSIVGKINKTVRGKDRQLGIKCKIQVKKNRITGRERTIMVPIYYSVGIDDIGSCVDYLIEEEHWTTDKVNITAPEFKYKGSREKFIRLVEEQGMEGDLRDIVGEVWVSIEAACQVNRKKRYK